MPYNKFELGARSLIEDYSVINNAVGDVIIGEHSLIGVSNAVTGPVVIGNEVLIGQNVVISALDHGYEDVNTPISQQKCKTSLITIEDDVWIGANVVITSGVRIGTHSTVAAGSVVVKDVPPFSLVVGNPARLIKQYNFESGEWERVSSK